MVFVELKKRICKFATKLAVSIEHNVNVKGNSGNYALFSAVLLLTVHLFVPFIPVLCRLLTTHTHTHTLIRHLFSRPHSITSGNDEYETSHPL